MLRDIKLTSKEMCSLSILTSNSCRPTIFFFGHATSSSLASSASFLSVFFLPSYLFYASIVSSQEEQQEWTHFVTSLSLIILFNSSATAAETNTVYQYSSASRTSFFNRLERVTYSLFGLENHFYNSSCLHNGFDLLISICPLHPPIFGPVVRGTYHASTRILGIHVRAYPDDRC